MSRYIDADAIITFVSAGHLRNPMEKTWSDNDVIDMIESRPTVDVCLWCGAESVSITRYSKTE